MLTPYVSQIAERIRGQQRSIVFPEGGDPRVQEAAAWLADSGMVSVVTVNEPDGHTKNAPGSVSADDVEKTARYVEAYSGGQRKVKPAIARRLMKKPLFFGAMMVACGDADGLVAGVTHTTARVVEAGMMCIGAAPGVATPSSFFLMLTNRGPMVFADCAVNVSPDASQLADIAVASAHSASALLGDKPRVAFLSFSTHGSATHEKIDTVTEALDLARQREPGIDFDGELQADTALSATVASAKLVNTSAVAGQANVLVFPDLNAGNIAYKLTQYLGGAQAIGPFLQGFDRPISDLSRGASVADIVQTAIVVAAMADDQQRE